MSTTIDSLSIDITANASKAVKNLESLGEALADLKEKGKLTTTINNLNKLAAAVKAVADASAGIKAIGDLQNNLNKLNQIGDLANVKAATSSLNGMSKAMAKFTDGEQIAAAGEKIALLSESLKGIDKLKKSVDVLNGLQVALEGLSELEGLSNVDNSIKTMNKLGEALEKIKANGAIGTAINNIEKIPEKLKDMGKVEGLISSLERLGSSMSNIASASNVGKSMVELGDALEKMKEQAKITTVNNNLEKLAKRLEELRSVQDVIKLISELKEGLLGIFSLSTPGSAKEIAENLKTLGDAITSLKKRADFSTVVKQLKTLSEAVGELSRAENGIAVIRDLGSVMSGVSSNGAGEIVEIAGSIRKLVNAFKPLAELDVAVLSHKVKSLVTTFSGFQNIGDMTGLQMLAKNLRSLINTAGKLNDVDFGAFGTKMRELGAAIQPLKDIEKSAGLTSIMNNLRKIPKLSEDLNKVDFGSFKNKMGELAKSLEPLQGVEKATGFTSLIRALKDIPKITEQLNSENIKKFAERLKELVKELEPVYKRMSKMSGVIGSFNLALANGKSGMTNFVSATNDSNVILNATIELFMKLVQAVQRLANKLSESINIAINMDGIIQRIGNSFGEQSEAINNELERMAQAFKLNKQEIMQYTGIFGSLLAGFGVATDKAKEMSLGLTQAAYDLWASNNDLYPQYESVARALKSAITGELEPIRNLGISISKAMLQATAARHGITQTVDSMTEAQKSILRYQAIVEAMQKKGIIGEYAREMNTAEGAVRMLKQQLRVLGQEIGSVFIPLLLKVVPIITAFVRVVGQGVSALAKLLGIDFSKIDWSGFKSNVDGLGESLQESKDTATDLKRTLLGFDEINKLQDDTKAGVNLDAYDLPLDVKRLWDDSIYKQVNSNIDKLTKSIGDKFKKFAKKVAPLLQPAIDSFNKLKEEGLARLGDFSWGTLKDFYTEFLKPVGEWVLGSGLPRFLDITNDLLNEIDWDKLKGALKDFYKALANLTKLTFGVLLDFYEYFLKPVAVWTMNEALPRFLEITTKLINSVDWAKLKASLTELWKALAKLTQMTFTTLLDFYEKFLVPIAKWTLGEGIPRLAQATAKLVNDIDWKKLLESLSNLYSKLKDFTIDMVFTPLIEFYENFLVPLGTWTMSEALPKLADTLSDLFSGDWVDNLPGPLAALKDFFGIKLEKTSVWKDLAEALKEFWKGLEPILEAVGTGTLAVLCKTLESFALVGKLLLQYLVAPTLEAIGKVLQAIPPSVFETLAVAITTFVLSIKGLTIVGVFKSIFSMSNAMGIANSITKFFGPILRVIYANPVAVAIALAMGAIYMFVKNWDSIKYVLKVIGDGIVAFFKGIWNGIIKVKDYLAYGFQLIIDFFAGVGKYLGEGFSIIGGWLGKLGNIFISPFKKAFAFVIELIKTFASGDIVGGIKMIINAIKNAFSTAFSIVTAPFRLIIKGLVNIIDFFIPGFKDKAGSIVTGIKDGITKKVKEVWEAIKYIAKAIKDKFCELLGIHSPSTVFQGYAGNIIDGLINGLKAGIGKITSVVNNYLVKPVSEGMGKVMDSVLSNNTQIKIGDRLRMLAGESEADIRGFQLKKKVPKYASGGYPQKGQMFIANEAGAEMVGSLDGKTAVANQDQITNALVAALYPAIRDAFRDANQGQSTEVNVTLEGDANKMFRVMQQKGKAYQLSTGKAVF